MSKKLVYFNEFNIPTKSSTYLPYSSGLLRAYAETNSLIKDYYEFAPFLFVRDDVDKIINQYKNPEIIAFSVSVWNFQLSLYLAKKLKEKFSKSLIVFGGPNVPLKSEQFFKDYPFIDIGIYGEGERLFTEILEQNILDNKSLPLKQTLYKDKAERELDKFPSPYTNGLFDEVMNIHKHMEFKAIIETNRACPFFCSFCFWGQGSINKKLAYHSLEYTKAEAEWIGKHDIKYVFCADANFGMFKRDIEIAQVFADIKKVYSFPEKFRVCYGKNTVDSIFETASILSKSDLAKTVTLAIQSNDEHTLKNIKRSNIKMDAYIGLQKKYTEAGIPTYTEIILGLPGETKTSFLDGINTIISSIINNQVFIYHCQILPNTEMADLNYREQHGIQTVKVPMAEVHGNVRLTGEIPEFEEIVIGTNSMPTIDWKECAVVSWIVQLCHGLKICFDITEWAVKEFNLSRIDIYHNFALLSDNDIIKQFWNIANDITNNKIRCQENPIYGEIYWEPEEMAFLNIAYNKDNFYESFEKCLVSLLDKNKIVYNILDLKQIIKQQKDIIPDINEFNNPEDYATQVILYGRKSNKTTKNITNRQEMPLTLAFN